MAKVLVVDDHPRIVRLVERELSADGHEVITAGTGEEALRKAREEAPDLVVLDVMLPGKDGFQVLQELKGDPATQAIPVILLTARDHPSEVTYGLRLGADWYLPKPFHAGDIATLTQRFVEDRAAPVGGTEENAAVLPTMEIDLLTMAAADAQDLARRGDMDEGYACLSAGVERAEAARAAGRPWAEELARRYEDLRLHFAARHGRGGVAAEGVATEGVKG